MDNIIDYLDEFKSILVSIATGGKYSSSEYERMRGTIIALPEIKDIVPSFIKANRLPIEFFRYMQDKEKTYEGRRRLIKEGMQPLFDYYESGNDVFSGVNNLTKCELLGKGGFGEVYRYHNESLDMDFAVKIYDPCFVTDEAERIEGEKRFFREAKMLFSLNDKHIVRIYDAGRIKDKPFIRMEYLSGETLDRFRKGNLPLRHAVNSILQVLSGLRSAHAIGIIHRDLKPSNIMVIPENQRYILKIIDFGISAFIETEGYTRLTRTGENVAGGQFTDPNLIANPKLRDVRSDIYSIGAILYFLLTGRSPVGSDIRSYLYQANQEITSQIEEVIMRCLSVDINRRYSSCYELIETLHGMGFSSQLE